MDDTVLEGDALQARSPGRRRDEATRKAILRSAFDTLASDGYRSFTIERVAARSGAGKTTIYRWWDSKEELAVDAFLAAFEEAVHEEGTGSAIEELKTTLRALVSVCEGRSGRVLSCILGSGGGNSETTAIYRDKIARPRREIIRHIIERGIATGEIRRDVDVDSAIDALFLPVFARLMFKSGPVDIDWVNRLADNVLRGLQAPAVISAE